MEIAATALPDVKRITPRFFIDPRGAFSEVWNARAMAGAGLDFDFVQDNLSVSHRSGTIRGLHYQAPPSAQTKLVRVARGRIRDIAVDIRRASPTFGQWVAQEISDEDGGQILIPRGFLHGFVTLEDETHVLYKVDAYYDAARDRAIRFDDPDIGIDWGIAADAAVLSGRDTDAPLMRDIESPFVYGDNC